jgi:hypothetical protein
LTSFLLLLNTLTAGGDVKRHVNERSEKPIAPWESAFNRRPLTIPPFIRAVLTIAVESALLEGDKSPVRAAPAAPLASILGSLECIIHK